MKAIIVGGGIGGLCAAIALRARGIGVQVFEQASALSEVGAGIQLASNGALILRALGIEEDIARVATQPDGYDYRDLLTGQQLYYAPLGPEAARRYGAPMYNIHRADLIDILARHVPAGQLITGRRITGVGQTPSSAWIELDDGLRHEGDFIVGADGIHSAVRTALFGQEQTQFSNILMWRSLIPKDRIADLDLPVRGNNWFGPGRTLITYWVRPDLYSVLASVPTHEVTRESWTDSGDIEDLLRSFADVEPKARRLLESIETSFITGMYYRDPIPRWTQGRITLLGDAAHAMVPFLAQGACQSIEDAWTLASCMAGASQAAVPERLVEYQNRRIPRTTRVQAGARAIVKMVHESAPDRIQARNGRWRGMARIDPLAETSWGFVWGHDEIKAASEPVGHVVGLAAIHEGAKLQRSESQRAFELWKSAFTPEDVARGHDGMREAYERFLLTHFPADHVPATAQEIGGVACQWIEASAEAPSGWTILHLHGGAYVLGSARSSVEYAARLAAAVNGQCCSLDYRRAPEHPYPAALDDALDVYRGLIRRGLEPARIVLSGESSGAGLALALAMALRHSDLPMPAGVLAVCPFGDLTLSGPSLQQAQGQDPAANRDLLSLMGASYFQAHEPTDPLVSPVFGDYRSLPPLYLTAAENEALFSDAQRIRDRAIADGVRVQWLPIQDSVHVYPLFPFLPETRHMLQHFSQWVDSLGAGN